jgi:hypothetical protein
LGAVAVVAFAVQGRRSRQEDSTPWRWLFDDVLFEFFEGSGHLAAAVAALVTVLTAYGASKVLVGRLDEPFVTGGALSAAILAAVAVARVQTRRGGRTNGNGRIGLAWRWAWDR